MKKTSRSFLNKLCRRGIRRITQRYADFSNRSNRNPVCGNLRSSADEFSGCGRTALRSLAADSMGVLSRFMVVGCWLSTGLLQAGEIPQWWETRGVLRGAPAHDFHPVNQGQVKWMGLKAYEEFLEKLPGDANTNLLNRIDQFPEGNNFRPANLGMLKAVALPFYERLIEEGYALDLPWAGKEPRDYALANQGQLKNLFRVDLDAFDSNGNGLPDWWERLYGLSDPQGDPDGDGWTNLQEYQLGTDPLTADFTVPSDENTPVGNGAVNPPSGPLTDVLAVSGSAIRGSAGAWVLDAEAVYAAGRRGSLTYVVDVPQDDIYRLSFEVAQQTGSPKAQKYRLRIAVDGHFVARRDLVLSGTESQAAVIDTPFLNAGGHTVELLWDNYETEAVLRVERLRLQEYPGMDDNANGIKDWVENRLAARNTVDVAPAESRTSPVCLEGRGLFAGAIQAGGAGAALPGANDRWFADAALAEDGSPTDIVISMENGGRILNRRIRWKETNLLTEPLAGEVVRRGDALRLVASLPEMVSGTAEIKVNGQSLGSGLLGDARVYRFEQDGDYVVEGSATGLNAQGDPVSWSRAVRFRVCSAPEEVIAAQVSVPWKQHWRPWGRPAHWPAQAVAEWDSRLDRRDGVADGETQFCIYEPEKRHGVIRLRKGGPVLAPITVKGFNLWFMRHTYLHYDEIYEDGSFRAQTSMIMSPVVPEVRINQRCRGTIAYEDGSRVRDFSAGDFNAVGEVTVVFYHSRPIATSVCHYTDVYQNDVLIGRSY